MGAVIRSRTLRHLALAMTASALFGVACSGGGHQSPPPAGYTGEFQVARYLTYLPGVTPSPYLFADAHFLTTSLYLDAGGSGSFAGPGGTIPLVRLQVANKILYQKQPGSDLDLSLYVPGSDYSLTISGSHLDKGVPGFTLDPVLHTPAAFSLTSPDITGGTLTVVDASDLSLTWTA